MILVFSNLFSHSGILPRVDAIAYISLGVALALLILPKIRCRSEIPDSDFLKKFNKFGIPFNAFFSSKFSGGIILSELLTEKEIYESIEKLK